MNNLLVNNPTHKQNDSTQKRNSSVTVISGILLLCTLGSSSAVELTGRQWSARTFNISTGDLTATGANTDDWEAAFNTAAGRWNSTTPFSVTTDALTQNEDCDSNSPSTTFFSDTRCGNPWPMNVLGVSSTFATSHDNESFQTSIVFNDAENWQVNNSAHAADTDFTRVAVHEIGHSMGLSHSAVNNAIMFPTVGDGFTPESDDLSGINLLYGVADMASLPDFNASGSPEIVGLRMRASDRKGRIQIREALDGSLVSKVNYFAGYDPKRLTILDDRNANGIPEIALLETRQSDGRNLVEVRDAGTGNTVTNIFFSKDHNAKFIAAMDDISGNGHQELAVVHIRDSDDRTFVQIRDVNTKLQVQNMAFTRFTAPLDMVIVPDMNGNGADEIAVLLVRFQDARALVQIRDSLTRELLTNAYQPVGFTAHNIAVVNDINANGFPEIATLVVRDSDGRIGVRLHDSDTGTSIQIAFYSSNTSLVAPQALSVFSDNSANGFQEIGVLMQLESNGRPIIELRDSSTKAITKKFFGAPNFVAEVLKSVPATNAGNSEEVGVLGFNAGASSQARVYDSDTATQITSMFFPVL